MVTARQRRPLPRFTLRVLLAVITLLCIGLSIWTHGAREQARIVEHIRAHHGNVIYDWEPPPGTPTSFNRPRSPVPAWLLERLGEDFFHRVVWAHVRGDIDLEQVSRLTAIRDLTIWKEDLTDDALRPITGPRQLQTLTIQSDKHVPATTRVGDSSLALLARLPRLEKVYVDGHGFTSEGLAALAESQSLRSVWINYCHPSVTPEAIEPLRRAGRVKKLVIYKVTPGQGEEEVIGW